MGGYEKETVDNKELGMGKVETTIEGRAEKWEAWVCCSAADGGLPSPLPL